ncbi:MAG: hypothetical protein ACO3AQ_05495, partial [Bacteroidia bacterium]
MDSGMHMCVEPESTKHFISVDFSGCLGFESFTIVCTNPIILIYTKIPSSWVIVNEIVLRFSQLKKTYTSCWILIQQIIGFADLGHIACF